MMRQITALYLPRYTSYERNSDLTFRVRFPALPFHRARGAGDRGGSPGGRGAGGWREGGVCRGGIFLLFSRRLGYRVLDADIGEMALIVMAQHPEIALVFTDVVMPRMTGRQLVDVLGLTQPLLKVLYTTDYTRKAIVHNGTLDRGVALLPKPFTLRDLAIKVRQVLDS